MIYPRKASHTVVSSILQRFFFAFVFLLCCACTSLPDRLLNGTHIPPPYEPDPLAERIHQRLVVVDLHADTLLWNRDLLERASYGNVDVPRLREGNVALQVFGVVTGVPLIPRPENNRDSSDVITLLAKLQDWPAETYDSRVKRALYQAEKLADRVRESNGALKLIYSRRDLEELLAARNRGERIIGALLALEGAHGLEGEPANIDRLFKAGFRMLGLAHFFDNAMCGSAHGQGKYGLTKKGHELISRALARGMIIDLAHASPQAIDDVLATVNRPVIASHGGVRGTCDTVRNLDDRHIIGIARSGGVIGIGLFKYASCGKTLDDTVRAMRYVADLVGVEHVALGSDFDGATATVVDATGLVMLTQALLRAGFSEEEIAAIMGGNALRVFLKTLPDG
jgi:membrane dipeptidase